MQSGAAGLTQLGTNQMCCHRRSSPCVTHSHQRLQGTPQGLAVTNPALTQSAVSNPACISNKPVDCGPLPSAPAASELTLLLQQGRPALHLAPPWAATWFSYCND